MSEQPETVERNTLPEPDEPPDYEAESLLRRLRCYELRVLVSTLEAFGEYTTGDAVDAVWRAIIRTANRIGVD